jgi:ABC-2 type transport system permease protein
VVAAAVAVCWIAGSMILESRDANVSLDDHPNVLSLLIAVVVFGALLTWFGFGAGTILKSSPLSIVFLLAWPLIIESLIAVVLYFTNTEGAQKWLPYQAGFGALSLEHDSDSLGRPGGLIWFGAIAVTMIAAGVVINERRDA